MALSLLAASAHADHGDARVTIHLRADDPRAVLERRPDELSRRGDLAGVDGWRAVCVAPCTATFPRRDRLRVGGSGIEPMELYADRPGSYDVMAYTASSADETAGLALVLVGAALALGGAIAIPIALDDDFSWSGPADDAGPIAFTAALTSTITGGILIAIGAGLRFSGGSGELEVTPKLEIADGVALTPNGLEF